MDGDSIPRSMIYAQVEPEHIADVNWIMEGYPQFGVVDTVDVSTGIMKFATITETCDDLLALLENLPFSVNLLDSYAD